MKKTMDLNKETASRLWVKQFGKKQKAVDFSGREIARAAYNDRNSEYGWNVDHILPESRGGKTADHNLICCHIKTNDEKADKFPCFKANGKVFEIQQRQNHYEIFSKSENDDSVQDDIVNFLDAAQGLKCWKQCKADGKDVCVGYVKIKVETENESDQLLERYRNFLSELFNTDLIFVEDLLYSPAPYSPLIVIRNRKRTFVYTVIVDNIFTKKDTQNLLDDCVILNTYSIYFTNKTGFDNIQIVCGMEQYESRFEATLKCKKSILEKRVWFNWDLAIDELVKINTSADKELKDTYPQNGFYCYDYTYTQLKKNLEKRI